MLPLYLFVSELNEQEHNSLRDPPTETKKRGVANEETRIRKKAV